MASGLGQQRIVNYSSGLVLALTVVVFFALSVPCVALNTSQPLPVSQCVWFLIILPTTMLQLHRRARGPNRLQLNYARIYSTTVILRHVATDAEAVGSSSTLLHVAS